MKKLILIAVLLAGGQLYAQDATNGKSTFGKKIYHSGYGALTTTIQNLMATMHYSLEPTGDG